MADKTAAVISDGAWQANTAYSLGDTVSNDILKIYGCITAGTSAASGGPTGTGSDITDNTVHWAYKETVGAAYTSLNAAFSGESGDLVTNTCLLTTHCHNFEDTNAAATGAGYTVSTSYYINVESYDNHGGVYGTNAYRLVPGNYIGISVEARYTRLTGIQVCSGGASNDRYGIHIVTNYDAEIDKCIVKKTSGAAGNYFYGINIQKSYPGTTIVKNSIVYDCSAANDCGIRLNADDLNILFAYNCTVVNSTIGFLYDEFYKPTIKNCITVDCTTGFSGNADSDSAYNGSDANDAPGSNPINLSSYADTDIFLDPANDDFHLKSTSPCKNVGVDLSATFTDDIDGETRPTGSGTWDIGADEYISGVISGTTCWGHSTGVEEENTKTFTGNGSGTATISGSGDSEVLIIAPGEYWNFNTIDTNGAQSNVTITLGKYVSGGNTVTKKYRTGTTQAECEAASFSTYSGPVSSDGFFQARLEG